MTANELCSSLSLVRTIQREHSTVTTVSRCSRLCCAIITFFLHSQIGISKDLHLNVQYGCNGQHQYNIEHFSSLY